MADPKVVHAAPMEADGAIKSLTNTSATTGTVLVFGNEKVSVPVGVGEVEVRPRQIGDFYAELRGKGIAASGCAPTQVDAVRAAVSRASA